MTDTPFSVLACAERQSMLGHVSAKWAESENCSTSSSTLSLSGAARKDGNDAGVGGQNARTADAANKASAAARIRKVYKEGRVLECFQRVFAAVSRDFSSEEERERTRPG